MSNHFNFVNIFPLHLKLQRYTLRDDFVSGTTFPDAVRHEYPINLVKPEPAIPLIAKMIGLSRLAQVNARQTFMTFMFRWTVPCG